MLRIEYICHSCLYISTGDTTLVIDPWFKGTAYKGQWYLFPQPVNTDMIHDAENILISHGHDDHLHEESLREISKNTKIFFPYQWRAGVTKYLKSLGFRKIIEAITCKSYSVSPTTTITYIGFSLESVIVIECDGKVIVNLNDALNSHHENIVKMFLHEIKKRWNRIDYLFSGWSGAGYFPNTIHYKNKDDIEIGRLREQYFANNFCRFVKFLEPERAIPFTPGFALLAHDKRWINEIKFPRTKAEQYYRENFDAATNVEFCIMQPGSYFEDEKLNPPLPCYTEVKNDSFGHDIDKVFEKEIIAFNRRQAAEEKTAEELKDRMQEVLNYNSSLYDKIVLDDATFVVILTDVKRNNCFNVDRVNGGFIVTRSNTPFIERKLHISTTSRMLKFSFEREWGADVMTIGYGLDVEVFEELTLEKNLDIVCVRLLSLYPRATDNLFKQPFRSIKWLITNPIMSALAIKQKITLRAAVNKYPYNERDHWISYSKCDLCQVCNMPLLSKEFSEQL
ncbi:MAG: MBL fold metallo-hydrolase [Bacteroidota bacterium]